MPALGYAFVDHSGATFVVVGILAQSGGFFIHMAMGQPDRASIGTTVTTVGAILLTCGIAVLVYGLSTAH
jgi:hypothetical protein